MNSKREPAIEDYIWKRLVYVKRLYIHGVEHAKIETQIDSALAILNFDNAIEMLFYTLLEHLDQPVKERRFSDLLNAVSAALRNRGYAPETLLYEREIINLHDARNHVQHHGIVPSIEDIERFQVATESMLANLAEKVFGVNITQLSPAWLIEDEVVRALYQRADDAYLSRNYFDALVYCAATFEIAKCREQDRIYGSGLSFRMAAAQVRAIEDPNFKGIVEYLNILAEEVEILKLRLDYKQYQKYRTITFHVFAPFARIENWYSQDINQIATKVREALKSEMVGSSVSEENVRFCLVFTIESILRWESVRRETWYETLFRSLGELVNK